jgi:uncharacterized membrane protein
MDLKPETSKVDPKTGTKTGPKVAARPASLAVRMARLHGKIAYAVLFGVAVYFVLKAFDLRAETRVLIGWDAGVALYLWLTHRWMRRADVAHIRRRAALQDEGAFLILLMSIVATVASLVAIVFEIGGAKGAPHGEQVLPALLAFITILLSWTFVHTIFSLHYAHEYYGEGRDKKIGGLNFPGDDEPDYWDFLYFSLVIGMTSQVSDVGITSKFIRRMAAIHGVLSFFFNVTVLALTVNTVSNLI